ncbi:hypothetical protein A3D14_03560 [Candidatus Saccharibacteria bacterium RIFCSPHIGHO2_02_FULL_47_12]|nr:MAG: hypothetical protein A3D14_03560 [Candidatus Saccharibacteria bacterium RIFCSPHIGHO2_02_FULL_47_12]
MNKKVLAIIALIVIAGGGAILYSGLNKGEMAQETTKTSATDLSTTDTTPPSPAVSAGAYVDYSDGVIANTAGTKILFFHAPWCPQCRALEKSIKSEGVPSGVTIIKVDYDTNQKLRQKYDVAIQTTLVKIDDNGESIKSYVAYDQPNIESVKANLL